MKSEEIISSNELISQNWQKDDFKQEIVILNLLQSQNWQKELL